MTIKPTKNYRMSKTAKRMLGTIVDPVQRAALKATVISAELSAQVRPKAAKDRADADLAITV